MAQMTFKCSFSFDRVSLCSQVGLELTILLSLPPDCRDYEYAFPYPASNLQL